MLSLQVSGGTEIGAGTLYMVALDGSAVLVRIRAEALCCWALDLVQLMVVVDKTLFCLSCSESACKPGRGPLVFGVVKRHGASAHGIQWSNEHYGLDGTLVSPDRLGVASSCLSRALSLTARTPEERRVCSVGMCLAERTHVETVSPQRKMIGAEWWVRLA